MRAISAIFSFGQIKYNLKFRIFWRRGIEKIKMESPLLLMLHDWEEQEKILLSVYEGLS